MSRLPAISGREAIQALQRIGFEVARISGSHHILKKPGHPNVVTVPVHGNKTLKRGTLHKIIRSAGCKDIDEFVRALQG